MSISDLYDRAARAATNHALFREVNERVKELNEGFSLLTPMSEWICECANDTCLQRIELSADEYQATRKDGTHFVVAPNDQHFWADVERVIERGDRYWVVAKIGRSGGEAL